jgi:DinB superfamily
VPQTEVWQRGPVPGFEPLLMPVVHALLQVREDLERLVSQVPAEHVWVRPGGAASIGFHARHTGGALDRLFTYAKGATLSDVQKSALRDEGAPGDPPVSLATVVSGVNAIIDRALDQLASTPRESLLDERKLGRAGLPTTVLGLLFHAAEHSTRHVGQAITTARIVSSFPAVTRDS